MWGRQKSCGSTLLPVSRSNGRSNVLPVLQVMSGATEPPSFPMQASHTIPLTLHRHTAEGVWMGPKDGIFRKHGGNGVGLRQAPSQRSLTALSPAQRAAARRYFGAAAASRSMEHKPRLVDEVDIP